MNIDKLISKLNFENDPMKACALVMNFYGDGPEILTEEELDHIEKVNRNLIDSNREQPGMLVELRWKDHDCVDKGHIHTLPYITSDVEDYPPFFYVCCFPAAYDGDKEPRRSMWIFLGTLIMMDAVETFTFTSI